MADDRRIALTDAGEAFLAEARLALHHADRARSAAQRAERGETGNVISTANLTGSVPAAGTLVVDLNSVLTGFTASPRATLNVTVSGPNKQIQGLYQIVNPNSGKTESTVLFRNVGELAFLALNNWRQQHQASAFG